MPPQGSYQAMSPQGYGQPFQQPPQKSKAPLIIGIVGAVLALLIIIFVVLHFASDSGQGTSRDDFRKGLIEITTPAVEGMLTEDQIEQVADCVTDRAYDETSEEGRKQIAEGRDISPGQPDFQLIYDANFDCAFEIAQDGLTP